MNTNEQLIHQFYTAFQRKDYKAMQACYADNATFNDAVFQNLDAKQVRAMWHMLCLNGKDLKLEYRNVAADDNTGEAEWIARYTFSKTGNEVENRINARFTFANNKITTHSDWFDFYRWSRQAFGITGLLVGWTPFFKNKVRETAMLGLKLFMKRNRLE